MIKIVIFFWRACGAPENFGPPKIGSDAILRQIQHFEPGNPPLVSPYFGWYGGGGFLALIPLMDLIILDETCLLVFVPELIARRAHCVVSLKNNMFVCLSVLSGVCLSVRAHNLGVRHLTRFRVPGSQETILACVQVNTLRSGFWRIQE